MKVKLNSPTQINELIEFFTLYRENVDAICGRYTVDAKSYLGMLSLIGREVEIVLVSFSLEKKRQFYEELENILKGHKEDV